ncbi:hypothetical protein L1987_22880 [Smallanthus sonchifolius]|uniref:Uncharacterized protein n=1 Tax=Smallanthus sonchifolius TaxID=185202 RepID=A0ACB9IHU6_9ASTR|nr:hypothetical protein L1987_22880 [Smallanthus sonchifolius]
MFLPQSSLIFFDCPTFANLFSICARDVIAPTVAVVAPVIMPSRRLTTVQSSPPISFLLYCEQKSNMELKCAEKVMEKVAKGHA